MKYMALARAVILGLILIFLLVLGLAALDSQSTPDVECEFDPYIRANVCKEICHD